MIIDVKFLYITETTEAPTTTTGIFRIKIGLMNLEMISL